MLKVDEMSGEGEVRAVRKALVEVMNNLRDRIEEVKKATSPGAGSALGASVDEQPQPEPAAPKVACELNNGVAVTPSQPPPQQPRVDPLTGAELAAPASPPCPPLSAEDETRREP
mmetsp:Transcript_21497/g.43770  ORF Transcript_21497/g.43770 Transcript_21497/m.43770 type:complete len:115 (-) Transcript_21497:61-405(-)